MKIGSNLGMMLLGIWLLITGLVPILHLNFEAMGMIMSLLAVAAGALLLMNK
jgi:hypothetical protein